MWEREARTELFWESCSVLHMRVECSDGQLEGGETELKGYYCKRVSELCSNQHDSTADFDNHLEWERRAVTSVVLLGGKSAVLGSEVKQCLQIMPRAFWDNALGDLQGYLQICWVLVRAGADTGGNIVVAGM
eukprot:1888555-Rhodomonas_salina.2